MTPYLLTGAILWLLSMASRNVEQKTVYGIICLIVMVLFTGLRFEIGYDWLAYEKYFIYLEPNFSFDNYKSNQLILPVEYLYFLLNATIKYFGGNFELLLFIISAFNLLVIDRIAGKIDPTSRPFVWLVYFCLALIMVQFNILRQSIASSFILISLYFVCKNQFYRSFFFFILAVGFHSSTLMFAPVLLFSKYKMKDKYLYLLAPVLIIIMFFGQYFLADILSYVGGFLPGDISSKTELYSSSISSGNSYGISTVSIFLILLYTSMLAIFIKSDRNVYVNVAILLTLMILIAHTAFGRFPIFWNRIMCVSLPWQLATLWLCYLKNLSFTDRFFGLLVGGATMLTLMAYQLNRPENIAFVPYHSLVQVWLFNDLGDGRARSIYAVQEGQIAQMKEEGR